VLRKALRKNEMFEKSKDGDAARAGGRQVESSTAAQASSVSASGRSGTGQAIIGRSIKINGDVKGDEDLMIEGDVSGTVQLRNHALTIGKEGKVKADIHARSITVDGTTDGDLFASESIAIRGSANVRGNLLAPRVSLEDGARFKGSVEMDQEAVDSALGTGASKTNAKAEPLAAKPIGNNKPADAPQSAVGANR
jgi:cytoskeletal protein CcmA (bactofilin family)